MFDLMQQKPPTNIRYVGQGGGGWSVGGGSKLVVIGWIGGGYGMASSICYTFHEYSPLEFLLEIIYLYHMCVCMQIFYTIHVCV